MRRKIIIIIIILLIALLSLFILLRKDNDSYKVTEINIKNSNGDNIYSVLYKPNKSGKMPIVIYSHGLGATYRAGTDYAEELVKEGIMTLCFDFRGGSRRSKSDGLTTEMSFMTEYDDLETILETVKTWDFVDTDNIILAGSSQGGAVSALVSAKHDEVKGLILLYPALSIPDVFRNWYKSLDSVPDTVDINDDSITIGKKYFEDIWYLDPYSEVANDNKKIIIIHGTEDNVVSISNSEKLNNIYINSKLYKIEGAAHGFSGKYFEEALKYVLEYLKEIV